MSLDVAVPSNVKRRVKQNADTFKGIDLYDDDNKYPQKVLNAVASSGTASACAAWFEDFLNGQGYKDPDVANMVINSDGQTLEELRRELAIDRRLFRGVWVLVGYNAKLQVTSLRRGPFSWARLDALVKVTDTHKRVGFHQDWARESRKRFSPEDVKWFDLFTDDPEKIREQISKAGGFEKWNGHAFYYSEISSLEYQPAICDPVLEDCLTESGVKQYKYRGTETGWLPDGMLVTVGKWESDKKREAFEESLEEYQGADRSRKIIHGNALNKDLVPQWIPFADDGKDKKYEYTETSVRHNIIRQWGQPFGLHGEQGSTPLGSVKKEFEEARITYDKKTTRERLHLGQFAKKLLKNWHEGDRSELDFSVVSLLGGSEEVAFQEIYPDFSTKVVELGGSALSNAQRRAVLMLSFKMTEEQAALIFPDNAGAGSTN